MKTNSASSNSFAARTVLVFASLQLSLFAVSVKHVEAQSTEVNRYGISLGLMGTTFPAGLVYDEFLNERIEAQLSLGVFNPGLGVKYHFKTPQRKKWSFSAGAAASYAWEADKWMYQLPISLNYYGSKNFQYTFSIVPTYSDYIDPQESILPGIQIAYRMGGSISDTNRNAILNKVSIASVSLLSTSGTIGFSFERIVHPNLGLEFGLGLISANTGLKLYLPVNRSGKLNVHTGASHYFASLIMVAYWKTYFPIGLSYVNPRTGFRILLDAGPAIEWEDNIGSKRYSSFGANLRIGVVRFKK